MPREDSYATMPRETPNCNSLRVQRAGKMNGLEACRLDATLQLLTKENRREKRLHNQDIRIINLTLEFIQVQVMLLLVCDICVVRDEVINNYP